MPQTSTAPRISVVVPARNAAATIGRTLAALAAQQIDVGYEVIVVDSGSTDGTPAIVNGSGLVQALLHNPGGEPAGSRNLGARQGTGEVLAFTDADCWPEAGWLAAGLRALEDHDVDIIQGKVVPAGPLGPFDRSLTVHREYGLYETANLFVRREIFDRVGGFEPVLPLDARNSSPFGEDVWFVWRAKRAGASSEFAEHALVRHAVFRRRAREFVAERGRSRYFPPLVARVPELRAHFLYRRVFLSPSSMRFDLALAGLMASVIWRRRLPLAVAALPYAQGVARQTAGFSGAERRRVAGALVAADLTTCAALLVASAGARTPVL